MTELLAVVDGPGSAPALVLGPSLGTTVEMWRPQLPVLAGRFRVIRYEHRGHSGSAVPPGPYTLDDLGGDLLALLDRLGVARAHVAGVSLGGMVAMWLAAHAPDRVDRLVPICTSMRITPPSMWRDRAATVRAKGLAAIADALIDRWFVAQVVRSRPDLVAAARAMIAAVPDEGYASCCAVLETADLTPALDRVTAPTLVVAGADDPTMPRGVPTHVAAAIPGARVSVIPGAAHLPNLSHPEEVTRLMTRFLEEPDG